MAAVAAFITAGAVKNTAVAVTNTSTGSNRILTQTREGKPPNDLPWIQTTSGHHKASNGLQKHHQTPLDRSSNAGGKSSKKTDERERDLASVLWINLIHNTSFYSQSTREHNDG